MTKHLKGKLVCASDVYLMTKNGKCRRVMEMAETLRPEGETIYLKNVFGDERLIRARIREIHFADHRVVLEAIAACPNKDEEAFR